ncbi:MAG: mechanosensitive ion channel family protein [Candidatus Omnitrophica bacterium]|nr:mechanosensitive ion channel family protein [Candidatus Omnitrophota bacterium]
MNFNFSDMNPWILAPVIFLSWVLVLSIVKKIIFMIVRKLTDKTENKVDDLLLAALDFPLQLVVYASGVLIVERFFHNVLGPEALKYLLSGFKVIAIIAGILFVDRFIGGLIRMYSAKVDILKTSGGFAQGFVRIVVMGLGALILLDTFGVSITPIIASLGIGSLAVALALQPTLENFFSGIQLVADKPIQVGQFIKLESGEEGTVVKIGWRSTWICMSNNNTIVMPNKLLVNSRVTNYFYPNQEVVIPMVIQVHYHSDLEKVERVTLDVAREVLKDVDGAVKTFSPVARFQDFGDSGISLSVVLRSRDIASSAFLRHEFIKRVARRYAAEGIVMPYPTRTIVQDQK